MWLDLGGEFYQDSVFLCSTSYASALFSDRLLSHEGKVTVFLALSPSRLKSNRRSVCCSSSVIVSMVLTGDVLIPEPFGVAG